MDFRSARYWAADYAKEIVLPGSRVVDATMGNGHDTEWLCETVGETGHVYAFDVQREAVENTRARLQKRGFENRATLILAGHEHMAEYAPGGLDFVMFNLGWLPGTEHGVTTRVETTVAAAEAGLSLLRYGGLMTICVYPGHEEGAREQSALLEWGASLNDAAYDVLYKAYLNQPKRPPALLAIKKQLRRGMEQ